MRFTNYIHQDIQLPAENFVTLSFNRVFSFESEFFFFFWVIVLQIIGPQIFLVLIWSNISSIYKVLHFTMWALITIFFIL